MLVFTELDECAENTSTPDGAIDSTTTQASTTEEGATALARVVVVKDYQALGIALPIALLTVIICAALVAVGIYLCFIISGRNKGENHRYENLDLSTKTLERTPSEIEHANTDIR